MRRGDYYVVFAIHVQISDQKLGTKSTSIVGSDITLADPVLRTIVTIVILAVPMTTTYVDRLSSADGNHSRNILLEPGLEESLPKIAFMVKVWDPLQYSPCLGFGVRLC